MESELKKLLKAVTLELRHLLEGRYDSDGKWQPGDLERRLAAIGVRRDRASVPVDELGHLSKEDRQARKVVDAYVKLRDEAGVERSEAVAEFVRETAYTWANRLLALRCIEARELIDAVILQQEAYGGRSLEHHRLAQRQPELCAGDDDGLFAVLDKVFREQAQRLPMLFDPQAPGVALRPAPAALKDCFGLLSLNADTLRKYRIRPKEEASGGDETDVPNPFTAPDALGWAYQYWNTEEKDRVFEKVRTVKGAKIAGAGIVPATQLYTESYMVKFLVQNSLGATWVGMHADSKLAETWEYYVKDADRAPFEKKPVREVTFLDPACGSGHFLLEAFDLFYAMYQEEGELTEPPEICDAILTKNLFGIDIDARSVQIAEASLWMKAAERAFDYRGVPANLVAATASHLKGEAWEEFLARFESEPSVARVLRKFAQTMEHIDEIGSLARPAEDLREIIQEEHTLWERQVREQKEANFLFPDMTADALNGQLVFHEISDEEFGERLFARARWGLDAFTQQARESGDFEDQLLGSETRAGFRLMDLLSRRCDVVAANPPYMGAKDMGSLLKDYLTDFYGVAKYDLYAAFLMRCHELVRENGMAALVTMQSFLYTNRYADLRAYLLSTQHLTIGLHLGGFAFEALGDHVFAICCIWQIGQPAEDREMTMLDVRELDDKEAAVIQRRWKTYRLGGKRLRAIQGTPLLYDLPSEFFTVFESQPTLADDSDIVIREGVHSKPDERFRRFFWEVSIPSRRWFFLAGGGACQKWAGLDDEMVEFEGNGVRLRQMASPIIPSADFYGKRGLSYSDAGASGFIFTCRELKPGTVFSSTGPAIISQSDRDVSTLMAYLNSSFVSFLLNALNPGTHFKINDVRRVPVPATVLGDLQLRNFARQAIDLKHRLLSHDPASRYFVTCGFGKQPLWEGVKRRWLYDFETQQQIVALEIEIDSSAARFMGLTHEGVNYVRRCYRPSFDGENATHNCPPIAPIRIVDFTPQNVRISLGERKTYAEYPCQIVSLQEGCSFRAATEALCAAIVNGHPAANFGTGLVSDLTSEVVLRLLGHRWPKEIDAGEPTSHWSDSDGILSVTASASSLALTERVQQCLIVDEVDSSDFDDILGKSLGGWLTTEFFRYHTRQFKKRPVAWQLQSGRFTVRETPAFACLLYYHRLDADTFPKVRSQYVGPLRQRLETEQRGLMAIASDARSERQVRRLGELEGTILELQKLDVTLESVARAGFGPVPVVPALRQYAVDDAVLSLKARWLHRLSEFVSRNALADWLAAADQTGLHPDLGHWIVDAVTDLDHFCARVSPKPPEQKTMKRDPVVADLAALIAGHSAAMLSGALKLACDVWWARFDETIMAPLKERLKEVKAEQRTCEEQMDAEGDNAPADVQALKARIITLKADAKELTRTVADKTARASSLRKRIESWRHEEPLTWGEWLAQEPLFDQISSLDDRRPAPKTIADFIAQESLYAPDINDGVRVNIAPLQKAGLLAADVLTSKDVDKAIADRSEWRADERRWVREGKLPRPGWWPEDGKQ